MKRFYLCLLLLSISFFSQTQNAQEAAPTFTQTFSSEQYLADIDQLANNLTTKHPRVYEFTSKEDFWKLVNSKKASISDNTTYPDFIWKVNEIVASVGCGHTNLMFFNQESKVVPVELMAPFEAHLVYNRLFVVNPLSNSNKLNVGDEVFAINGVNVETIKEGIFKHISADGHNPSGKKMLFNGFFSFYIPYYFGFPSSYQLTIKSLRLPIQLTQLSDYKFTRTYLYPITCKKAYCYEVLDQNTAFLTISTFNFRNESQQYFDFLKRCFQDMKEKNLNNLIIDLRRNGGGSGVNSAHLLSYLAAKPFIYFNPETNYGAEYKKPIKPRSTAFDGDIFILIGNENSSSANHFLSLINHYSIATLIGEETGGTFTCNDNSDYYKLTNTGISVRNATQTFTTIADSLPLHRGIFPTHWVEQTMEDYQANRDAVLDYTLKLITNSK